MRKEEFIVGRQQKVRVNSKLSIQQSVSGGVLQRTVLSLVLFPL